MIDNKTWADEHVGARKFFDHVDSKGVYKGPEVWEHSIDLKKCHWYGVKSLGTLRVLKSDLVSVTIGAMGILCGLGDLEEVEGSVTIKRNEHLTSLQNLKKIGGNANFLYCPNLESLGVLETVKGDLDIVGCDSLKSLSPLVSVGEELRLDNPYLLLGAKYGLFQEFHYEGKELAGSDCSFESGGAEYFWAQVKEIEGLPLMDILSSFNKYDAVFKPFLERRLKGV